MSNRNLDSASGGNGGATQLAKDPGRARNIHVTLLNTDVANFHGVFFGRSRRELVEQVVKGAPGFALIIGPAVVNSATQPISPGQGTLTLAGGVITSYLSYILQGWVGELWACSDVAGSVQIHVFDGGSIEF